MNNLRESESEKENLLAQIQSLESARENEKGRENELHILSEKLIEMEGKNTEISNLARALSSEKDEALLRVSSLEKELEEERKSSSAAIRDSEIATEREKHLQESLSTREQEIIHLKQELEGKDASIAQFSHKMENGGGDSNDAALQEVTLMLQTVKEQNHSLREELQRLKDASSSSPSVLFFLLVFTYLIS